ncbi:MAG: hypothetical protein ACPG5B_08305 [Chitinophagales bacterium]
MKNLQKSKVYQQMSPDARVWIYQSSRTFNEVESKEIQTKLNDFVASWAAHGKALTACASVAYECFLIILVDEQNHSASGCSIDASVHFMKSIEQAYQIDLFNRLQIAYQTENDIKIIDMAGFKNLVAKGTITANTLVFNNMISQKNELENKWLVPVTDSWHKQLLPKVFS